MDDEFLKLMQKASEQTREGDVLAATKTIQTALRNQQDKPPTQLRPDELPEVIDVEARVVAEWDENDPLDMSTIEVVRVVADEKNGGDEFVEDIHVSRYATLKFKLYIPPGKLTESRPLLLMLHGCAQNPDDFSEGTRANDFARKQGWFVLYPEQSQHANPQRCWNWFKTRHQERGRGETAVLSSLVLSVAERYNVDASRVHVAGLSAGGAMAMVLGRAHPELFASVGVHSGLPVGIAKDAASALALMRDGPPARQQENTSSAHPVPPTIVFHGTRDTVVSPRNGEAIFASFSLDNQRPAHIERGIAGGRRFTRKINSDLAGKVRSELWLIDGAGHAWSGGGANGSYADSEGPDATSQMFRFFAEHPLSHCSEADL